MTAMWANKSSAIPDENTEDFRFADGEPFIPELDSIDRRLRRLRDEVLPISPYLLTVPTDTPFRLGNRFVNNWAVGKDGPFSLEEQQLQYMTFLMHHEGDSLLVAVGDWSDKGGNIMARDDSKPPSVTSAASAPLSTSTKKKISLNDYKSKAKSGAPPISTTNEKGKTTSAPSARTANNRQHMSKSEIEDTEAQKHDHLNSKQSVNGVSGQKRAVKHPADPPIPQRKGELGSRSPKRPRLSSVKSTSKDLEYSNNINNQSLPALLSPTLPPSSTSPKLPELLSPTLPPDIEEELARLEGSHPIRHASHSRDVSASSNTAKDESAKAKLPVHGDPRLTSGSSAGNQNHDTKRTDFVSKRSSSGSKSAGSTSKEATKNEQPLHIIDKPSHSERSESRTAAKAPPSPSSQKAGLGISTVKPRLVVRLRYGKSNKKRVEGLLKFSGKRKLPAGNITPKLARDRTTPPIRKEDNHLASIAVEVFHPPATINREKRPRPVENSGGSQESSDKRPKTMSNPGEKPRTPVPTAFKSPSVHQQHQAQGTPKVVLAALKATPRRPQSGTREVKTPVDPVGETTPGNAEKTAKMSPPTSSGPQASRSRENERRAWREEFLKYAKLGRELKHLADGKKSKTSGENVVSADKPTAATAIEAILCFILAFIADDRSKASARQVGDSSTWRTILAYWRVVEMTTIPYPHLHGLCLLLGAVSRDAIHAIDLERLAMSTIPGEHSPVPTPGSDGTTVTSDESKQYRKEFFDLKTRLPDNYKEAHRLWLDGSRELSEEIVMKEFPVTWSRRSRNFSERGKQQLKIGEYSGEYFLPLGRTTTPIEAVRFGLSILNEWCQKEEVDWQGQLGV